ncbi:MAG: DUF2332 domain-containing protein [Luteolibacter sp.]
MDHPFRQRFLRFAESECLGSSELYYHLSLAVAEDKGLLGIAESSGTGQPIPNLFFGAVHFLLASDPEQPLTKYYPSLAVTSVGNPEDAFPAFRSFVLSQREEITELLARRLVQTNEVRRSAYLFPSITYATRYFQGRPLALVEIGTSAGLNLLWDKYSYSYGDLETLGDAESPVLISSDFRGAIPDCLYEPFPEISHRIGLDLNIVDTRDSDEAAWLRALVWPEHRERRAILDASMQHRSGVELDLREGNGFSMITDLVSEIPERSVVCIYHTHVANQISPETQEMFLSELAELGRDRDLIHIFNNIHPNLYSPTDSLDLSAFNLYLSIYKNGGAKGVPLATTDGHAKWFDWLPTQTEGEQGGAPNPLPAE